MKVRALKNFIYDGYVRKAGEVFEAVGYSFTWLTKSGRVKSLEQTADTEDDLLVAGALPPLDEEPTKRRKRNG